MVVAIWIDAAVPVEQFDGSAEQPTLCVEFLYRHFCGRKGIARYGWVTEEKSPTNPMRIGGSAATVWLAPLRRRKQPANSILNNLKG